MGNRKEQNDIDKRLIKLDLDKCFYKRKEATSIEWNLFYDPLTGNYTNAWQQPTLLSLELLIEVLIKLKDDFNDGFVLEGKTYEPRFLDNLPGNELGNSRTIWVDGSQPREIKSPEWSVFIDQLIEEFQNLQVELSVKTSLPAPPPLAFKSKKYRIMLRAMKNAELAVDLLLWKRHLETRQLGGKIKAIEKDFAKYRTEHPPRALLQPLDKDEKVLSRKHPDCHDSDKMRKRSSKSPRKGDDLKMHKNKAQTLKSFLKILSLLGDE